MLRLFNDVRIAQQFLGGRAIDSERFQRIKEVFLSALDRDPEARGAYLDEACGTDQALRGEVESMLRADQKGDEALHSMIPSDAPISPDGLSLVGTSIGPYLLKNVIRSSERSISFQAVQTLPERLVTVKILKKKEWRAEPDPDRIETVAQKLVSLKHPSIVQIHEVGVHAVDDSESTERTDRLPYVVMQHIPQVMTIKEFVQERNIDIRERVRFFLPVIAAVEYGHQKGVVHGDIRSGNILVEPAGRVKITDFGLTQTFDPVDPDPESDVLALGEVLYELFCGESSGEKKNMPPVQDGEHACRIPSVSRSSSSTRKLLRGDLRRIIMKALDKERENRYLTVDGLRRDIENYLAYKPVSAHPPSVLYSLRLRIRRLLFP